jgi:hypothetical protein
MYCFIFLYSVNVIVSFRMMNQTEPAWYCLFWQFLSRAHAHYKDVRAFHKIVIRPTPFNQQSISGTLFSERNYQSFQGKSPVRTKITLYDDS